MSFNPSKYDYSGKVILITGSNSGIGEAMAIQFATYGAKVVLHGRDPVTCEAVAKQIEDISGGQKPLQIIGDLVLEDDLPKKLIDQTIAEHGQLDVLINNAGGMTPMGNLASPNLMEEYDNVMKLNVRAVVELTQLAVPHLEKTKGNIINVASIAALKPMVLVYCTSKAAVQMVTYTSALELGPKGIRVNSINPGYCSTNLGRSMGLTREFTDAVYDGMKKHLVLGRVGSAHDIANLASFLASDDAVNITGSLYLSDSGFMLNPYDFTRENLNALQ